MRVGVEVARPRKASSSPTARCRPRSGCGCRPGLTACAAVDRRDGARRDAHARFRARRRLRSRPRNRRRGSCSGRRRSRGPCLAPRCHDDQPKRSAAAVITARARVSSRWRRRNATGSAPRRRGELVHEALDREHVHVGAERRAAPRRAAACRARSGVRRARSAARRAEWRCGRRRLPAAACGFGGAGRERRCRDAAPASRLPRARRARRMRVAPHLVLPVDDRCRRRRATPARGSPWPGRRAPSVLLLAHPLHAHRPAGQSAREQRRIGGGIVGAVVAVAARAFHVDAAHLLLGQGAASRRSPGAAGTCPARASRRSAHRHRTRRRRRTGRSSRASGRAAIAGFAASARRTPTSACLSAMT